jgi:hypothetical protein
MGWGAAGGRQDHKEVLVPLTIKQIKIWRGEVENKPGVLAQTLEPLAAAGVDLQVLMGYRYRGTDNKAAVEAYPVSGKKAAAAAASVGLGGSEIPILLVQGDNKPGLGYAIARAIADAGINIGFIVAQVVGRKYSAVIGLETDAEAKKVSQIIRKVAAKRKK